MRPYEKLLAWQHCHQVALLTYRITEGFPRSEQYGITSQMRRASVSAAANIAEGSAKRGFPELRRYLDITLGSLSELSYLGRLSHDLKLLEADPWREFEDALGVAGRTTMALARAISKRLRSHPRREAYQPTNRPTDQPTLLGARS